MTGPDGRHAVTGRVRRREEPGQHVAGSADPVRAVGRSRYRPSVCSIPDAALQDLARAIDELAADSAAASPGQLAERIARLWGMLTELDPELARRRSAYEGTPDGEGA